MNWNDTQKNERYFYWGRISYKSTKIYIKASKQEVQYSFIHTFWCLVIFIPIYMLRNCNGSDILTLKFPKISLEYIYIYIYIFHSFHWGYIVCTSPLSAGGGVEPPTKFSKRGAWQSLSFERGVAGKKGGNFFQGGLQFLQKETKIWNI